MTYLGVDFGLKKIGLAISDGMWPSPLPVLTYNSQEEVIARIMRLISDNGVDKIIFGLPIPDKIGAKNFGEKLSYLSGVPVQYIDETLSTKDALEETKGKSKNIKAKEDSLAAGKLLADFLDCC